MDIRALYNEKMGTLEDCLALLESARRVWREQTPALRRRSQ